MGVGHDPVEPSRPGRFGACGAEPLQDGALRLLREAVPLRAGFLVSVEPAPQVVGLDEDGRWDDAVALATTTGPEGTTGAFTEFDTSMAQVVSDAAASATSSLRGGTWVLLAAAGLWVVLGGLAAGAAWRGVSVRLGEYS